MYKATNNHHPVVQPLYVLDWKWDNSVSPPTKLVLVQWSGLAPKDTTWESYDALCKSYMLAITANHTLANHKGAPKDPHTSMTI